MRIRLYASAPLAALLKTYACNVGLLRTQTDEDPESPRLLRLWVYRDEAQVGRGVAQANEPELLESWKPKLCLAELSSGIHMRRSPCGGWVEWRRARLRLGLSGLAKVPPSPEKERDVGACLCWRGDVRGEDGRVGVARGYRACSCLPSALPLPCEGRSMRREGALHLAPKENIRASSMERRPSASRE